MTESKGKGGGGVTAFDGMLKALQAAAANSKRCNANLWQAVIRLGYQPSLKRLLLGVRSG
jgi:hypothetical protein